MGDAVYAISQYKLDKLKVMKETIDSNLKTVCSILEQVNALSDIEKNEAVKKIQKRMLEDILQLLQTNEKLYEAYKAIMS